MTDPSRDFIRPRDTGRSDDRGRAPLRVLFLCTGNSARSQIAEALLARKGAPLFEAGSAGVQPRSAVHPGAIAILREFGIEWRGQPKGIDAILDEPWDFVITVCDRAKESCPTFPGRPMFAHWGMPDPADIDDVGRRELAFRDTLNHLSRRIDLMLAIPFERLARHAAEERLRQIGLDTAETSDAATRE